MVVQIIIRWKYYKDKSVFNLDKARRKKEMVWFVDRDKYTDYIVDHMEYSDLQKLRLNMYNANYKLVKFTPFSESDINWNVFDWYDVESPVIELDNTDFAKLIPSRDYRKKFYYRDPVREKYFMRSDFIDYVEKNVI